MSKGDKPRKKLPDTRGTTPEELFVDSEQELLKGIVRPKFPKSKVGPRTSNLTRKLN